MSDLVERLRASAEEDGYCHDMHIEAAAEIERLRGLLERVVPYLDRGMQALHRDIAAALAGAAVQPTVGPWANIGPGLQECAFCHTTRHVQDQWERATSPAPAAKCACAEYYPELPHHPDCPTRNAAQQPTAPTSGGHDGD